MRSWRGHASGEQAELDHERRLNDLLKDRVELQARVEAGPRLPAPTRGSDGPPPNAPTGSQTMARPSPLIGEPWIHKGQQRSPAFNLANRPQGVFHGLASAGRADWVKRDPRQPPASSSGMFAAAVFLGVLPELHLGGEMGILANAGECSLWFLCGCTMTALLLFLCQCSFALVPL